MAAGIAVLLCAFSLWKYVRRGQEEALEREGKSHEKT
jgi:hypothetical protein